MGGKKNDFHIFSKLFKEILRFLGIFIFTIFNIFVLKKFMTEQT